MSDTDTIAESKHDWIRRVLGVEPGGTIREPPGLRGRLNAVGLQIRDLGQAPEAGQLARRFAQAVRALKAAQWQETESILEEIEPLIAGHLSTARSEEAQRVVASARVWREAVGRLTSALTALKAAVMAALHAVDEYDPEELDEIEDALDTELDTIADRLSIGLADQVDAVVNGSVERRGTAIPKIKQRIDEIEESLTGDETIAIIEENGLQPVSVAAPAKAALDELRRILDAAAS